MTMTMTRNAYQRLLLANRKHIRVLLEPVHQYDTKMWKQLTFSNFIPVNTVTVYSLGLATNNEQQTDDRLQCSAIEYVRSAH